MRKWWDDQWLLCINDVDRPTPVGKDYDDDADDEDGDAEPGLVGEDDDDRGGGKVFVVVHRLAPRVPCIGHLRRQCEEVIYNQFILIQWKQGKKSLLSEYYDLFDEHLIQPDIWTRSHLSGVADLVTDH